MTAPLNEQSRAAAFAAAHKLRGLRAERMLLIVSTVLLAGLLVAAGAGDYVLAYAVFNDILGPLPGEEGGASVAVMALSSLVAISAYAFYRKNNPDALAVRIVDRCAGFVALIFVIGMGLMAARAIYRSIGDIGELNVELFSEAAVEAGLSLLDRFFNLASGAFALCVGALVLCQLYLVDLAANQVWANFTEIARIDAASPDAARWTKILEDTPRRRAELIAEREALSRELESPAAFAFAHQLVAFVHEAIAPVIAWINAHELITRAPAGALVPYEPPSIDIAALKKRVAPLQNLDARTVHTAF